MPSTKSILLAAVCAFTASATPVPRATGLTADVLLQIDSSMATCAAGNDECATAAQAAPALVNAFAKYQITDPKQQAALVAYMYFESGHFLYNHNHFPAPGRPGQGTRMMAMPPFVAKYAAAAADPTELQAAMAKTGDDQLEAILATVNKNNDLSFGSAPWFFSTQCTDDVKAGLSAGTMDGWHLFLTKCVGTTADPARDPSYSAALKAFGGVSPGSSSPASSAAAPEPAKPTEPATQPAQPTVPAPSPAKPTESAAAPAPAKPTPAAPAPAKPTEPAPSQPAPAMPSSAPAQPTQPSYASAPAPAMPSATAPSTPSTPSTGNDNTCSNNGGVVCHGEKQFGLCNNGFVVWQDVAAGTSCVNGVISRRGLNGRVAWV